jgi:hypothetical protein
MDVLLHRIGSVQVPARHLTDPRGGGEGGSSPDKAGTCPALPDGAGTASVAEKGTGPARIRRLVPRVA